MWLNEFSRSSVKNISEWFDDDAELFEILTSLLLPSETKFMTHLEAGITSGGRPSNPGNNLRKIVKSMQASSKNRIKIAIIIIICMNVDICKLVIRTAQGNRETGRQSDRSV